MTWRTRLRALLSREPGERERGATATILAVFLAGGVIMGLLAVSVDLGNLTYERRQVQNAADATSMALASACAANETNCNPENPDVKGLLGGNSHDAVSRYNGLPYAEGACVHGAGQPVGTVLPPCTVPGDVSDLGSCPPLPSGFDPLIPYVESYAATQTVGNGDKLFLPFSRVLAGGAAGDKGSSACARAAWGKPVGYSAALPITLSTCEWDAQVIDGAGFAPAPSGPTPGYGSAGQPVWPIAHEVAIALHSTGYADGCNWNSKDFPGGFGWLTGDDCSVEVAEGGWAQVDTGNNVPSDCSDWVDDLLYKTIDIPVFDCIVNSHGAPTGPPPTGPGTCDPENPGSGGANTWYHLAGWAKFYVSGVKLSGGPGGSEAPGSSLTCPGSGNSGRCLTGWYVTGALADAPDIAAPGGPATGDFGAYVVKPIG